jgi:hypothetical protein
MNKIFNDHQQLLKGLINLEMNERNAKVYLALIKKKDVSVPELHKLTGIKQNKLYEVINSLIRDGYCSEKKIANKRFFNAINPDICIGSTLNKIEEKLKFGYELKDSLIDVFNSSENVKEPFEYIEIIHGSDNLHNIYLDIMNSAKFELFSLCRPPFAGTTLNKQKAQADTYSAFLKRGGKGKTIYEVNEESPPVVFRILKDKTIEGGEFRIATKLPLKMNIFDKKTLMIADKSTSAGENELSMTVIKQKTTVEGYYALVEFLWEQSAEYESWIVGNEKLMKTKLEEYENSSIKNER